MEHLTTTNELTYSLEDIIVASGIVIGIAVGAVLFVAATVTMTTVTLGALIGFVATRRLRERSLRIQLRTRRIAEASR